MHVFVRVRVACEDTYVIQRMCFLFSAMTLGLGCSVGFGRRAFTRSDCQEDGFILSVNRVRQYVLSKWS